MLYDPKWEVEAKADPFTLAALIEWLEKQPKRRVYCYESSGQCLLAQYFNQSGFKGAQLGHTFVSIDGDITCLPSHFQQVSSTRPWTFGKALARARAML